MLQQKLCVQTSKLYFNTNFYCMRKKYSILRTCVKNKNYLSLFIPQKFPSALLLHTTKICFDMKDYSETTKEIAVKAVAFQHVKVKDKDTFLSLLKTYDGLDKVKRGHVEFIYAALKYMAEYGVIGDAEVYKKLMEVFPKGKMIPKNLMQAEFYYFARHQDCAIRVLDQMECNGVFPDKELGEIIKASFGISSHVFKKYQRMMYWMAKIKNVNPYLLPDPLPLDIRELARLALKKMSVDVRTEIKEFETADLEDSLDKTWILSAQCPTQRKLIDEHSEENAIYVEGPYLEWLRKISMTYFVLRADSKIYPDYEVDDDDVSNLSLHMFGDPKPKYLTVRPSSVHEQEEGIVLGMCCTGTSSKDSLLSWIRFLRRSNPKLDNIPVLFKIRSSPTTVVALNADKTEQSEQQKTDPEESKFKQENIV